MTDDEYISASVAYTAYRQAVKEIEELPNFDCLPIQLQKAWTTVVRVILNLHS